MGYMLIALLVILIILWYLGYVSVGNVNIPNMILFTINGQQVTLWNLLTLLVIGAIIGVLPSPLREIAGVVLILWILSVLGILAFAGLSSLLILAIIIGLVLFLLKGLF